MIRNDSCLEMCAQNEILGSSGGQSAVIVVGGVTACVGMVFLARMVYHCVLSHRFRRQLADIEESPLRGTRNYTLYEKEASNAGAFCRLSCCFCLPAFICLALYLANYITYIHCRSNC